MKASRYKLTGPAGTEGGPKERPKFKVRDKVWFLNEDNVFRRGFQTQFMEEVYVVSEVKKLPGGFKFRVEALDGEEIKGWFTESELTLVLGSQSQQQLQEYEVERVVQRRGDRLLVKYEGLPSERNQWIFKGLLKLYKPVLKGQ